MNSQLDNTVTQQTCILITIQSFIESFYYDRKHSKNFY